MMVPLSLFIIWYGTCSCLIYMTLFPSVSLKVCSWWVTTLSHYIVKTYSWWIYNAPFSTLHHSDIFHSLYTPHISMNIIIPLMHLTRPVHGKSDKISSNITWSYLTIWTRFTALCSLFTRNLFTAGVSPVHLCLI